MKNYYLIVLVFFIFACENKPKFPSFQQTEDLIVWKNQSQQKKTHKSISSTQIHKNQSWLLCERMLNNDSAAISEFFAQSSNIPEVNLYRKQTAECRMELIKISRKRFIRPQGNWGERITDSLGAYPNTVILYKNGLAIYRKNRYSFFHKATLEIEPDTLTQKIEIKQGIDGFYYPVVLRDSSFIPLTYWGEIKSSEF